MDRSDGDDKPLICLRAQENVPLGIVEDVLHEVGVAWRYVDLWRGQDLPDLSECSGVIALGGAMNADEDDHFPWLSPVRTLLSDAIEGQVPVLGICLGAQMLARAAGGRVHAGAVREIGFHRVEVVGDDPVLAPFAPAAQVFQFHSDVIELPDGADLLAQGQGCAVQAFKIGDQAYGVQFHFEVTRRQIEVWCDDYAPAVLAGEWGTSRADLLGQAHQHLARQQRAGQEATRAFLSGATRRPGQQHETPS